MDLEGAYQVLDQAIARWPMIMLILSIMGSLVPVASAYVKMTPDKGDDKWWKAIEDHRYFGLVLRILKRFSLLERKKLG